MRLNLSQLGIAWTLTLLGIGPGCEWDSLTPSGARPARPAGHQTGRSDGQARPPSKETPGIGTHSRPHFYNRVVVLSIGVSKYRSPGIRSLMFAATDAEAVAERLGDLYGYETSTLVGDAATKVGIETELDRLDEQLGERDSLLVFFAGHGQVVDLPSSGRAGYLIPYDADLDLDDRSDPRKWATEAIDAKRLVERVESMRAQHVLVIADACFRGSDKTTAA